MILGRHSCNFRKILNYSCADTVLNVEKSEIGCHPLLNYTMNSCLVQDFTS